MWPIIIISGLVGLMVGRGIVAETSAHRQGLPDNWFRPECEECGDGLTPSMTRCSTNGHPQRWQTRTIPWLNGFVFALMAWAVPDLAVLPAYLVFAATMVTLTITDLQTKLIPNRILGPATIAGIVLLVLGGLITQDFSAIGRAAVGGVSYFGLLFILALIGRGALGFGDVKMSFIIGVFTGYLSLGYVIIAGVGAFIVAGIVSVLLIVTRRSTRKDMIPFGPFMTAAAIGAVLFGQEIIDWYLR